MPSKKKTYQKKCSYTRFREGKIKMFFNKNQRNPEIFLSPIWKDLLVKSLKDNRVQVKNLEEWMKKNPWIEATAAECANAFEEEEDENIEYLRDVVDSPFSTIMDYNQNVPGFDSPMTNISTFVALDPADHDHHEENANQNVTSSSSSGAAPRIKIEEVDVDDDDNREDLNTESEEAMPSSSGANSEEMNRSDSNDNAAADIEADDMDMDDNTPDANGQEETEVKKIEDALCYSQLIAQVCQNQNGLRACLPNLQSIFRALQRSHYRMIFGTSESYKDPTPVVPIVVDDDQDD